MNVFEDPARPPAREPSGPVSVLLATRTWIGIDGVLAQMLTDYLGSPFTPVTGAERPPPGLLGSHIALTQASRAARLELYLFAAATSARTIAAAFSACEQADVDHDTSLDVLLELANSAMGAVRAAFLGESLHFSGAIPRPVAVGETHELLARLDARILAFRSETATVHALVRFETSGELP